MKPVRAETYSVNAPEHGINPGRPKMQPEKRGE